MKVFKYSRGLKRHLNRKNTCESSLSELEIYKEKLKLKLEYEENVILLKMKYKNDNITNIENQTNIHISTNNIINFNINTINGHIDDNILTLGALKFGYIMSKCFDTKQRLIKILELIYKNSKFPEYQNIIYISSQDKFMILNGEWNEISYENVKPIILQSLKKVIIPYMDEFKVNGHFIMNNKDLMVPDLNLDIHFKLSDGNTSIRE